MTTKLPPSLVCMNNPINRHRLLNFSLNVYHSLGSTQSIIWRRHKKSDKVNQCGMIESQSGDSGGISGSASIGALLSCLPMVGCVK